MRQGWRRFELKDPRDGFDPAELAVAAKKQARDLPWLAEALRKCGPGTWESGARILYPSSESAAPSGWRYGKFEGAVFLDHDDFGTVIVWVAPRRRIGDITFADLEP